MCVMNTLYENNFYFIFKMNTFYENNVYLKYLLQTNNSKYQMAYSEIAPPTSPRLKHKIASLFTILFVAWQLFLPYSHGITKVWVIPTYSHGITKVPVADSSHPFPCSFFMLIVLLRSLLNLLDYNGNINGKITWMNRRILECTARTRDIECWRSIDADLYCVDGTWYGRWQRSVGYRPQIYQQRKSHGDAHLMFNNRDPWCKPHAHAQLKPHAHS